MNRRGKRLTLGVMVVGLAAVLGLVWVVMGRGDYSRAVVGVARPEGWAVGRAYRLSPSRILKPVTVCYWASGSRAGCASDNVQ